MSHKKDARLIHVWVNDDKLTTFYLSNITSPISSQMPTGVIIFQAVKMCEIYKIRYPCVLHQLHILYSACDSIFTLMLSIFF